MMIKEPKAPRNWPFIVMMLSALMTMTMMVDGCSSAKKELPLVTVTPIAYVDAGAYPQATSDVAPAASPLCTVTDEMRSACASLQKAHCQEGNADGAGNACPDHLARVCAEHTIIDTACVIKADGDAGTIRDCGTATSLRWRCIIK